jgi:NADH-quinone oxidoreductase subunit M
VLDSYILSILIFLPLVCSALIALLPSLQAAKSLALGGSTLVFGLCMYLWYIFDGSTAALQFTEAYEWIPEMGIKYIVGIDGLSLLLVVLTGFLTPLVVISQWHIQEPSQKPFLALILALESAMIGALVAIDLVFFYVFWEAMLIPMYFIVGIWGGKRRIYAATKFVIYTVVGSLLMLAAAIVLYYLHYEQFGTYSTSLLDLYRVRIPEQMQMWIFAAFALAFAIKVPLWPFHTWLPDAHVEAPTAGSVILAGILLKMGTYGLLRFAIPLFPEATVAAAPVFLTLGVIGIIYGALTAWMQEDAKKLVAYSSVSHLGFVVIGSFAIYGGQRVMSTEALTGAVYQMINHGLSTGALFFLVGIIYEKRHSRQLSDFGGLAATMPIFATLLIIATLGSVGLPGTGGFVGEFLILLGTFQTNPLAGILAASGVLLGAIYMLTLCKAILFGPIKHEENRHLGDVNLREMSYLVPLAVLIIATGVAPNLFLGKTKSSIEHLANNFQRYQLNVESRPLPENSLSGVQGDTERNLTSVEDQ